MNDDAKRTLRCSFCGKHEQQVHRMIQGPGVRICDECVQLCMSILSDGFEDSGASGLEAPGDQGRSGSVRDRAGRGQDCPVRGGL